MLNCDYSRHSFNYFKTSAADFIDIMSFDINNLLDLEQDSQDYNYEAWRLHVSPYYLDYILQVNGKIFLGNGGTRGWFKYCMRWFDLDIGYYCTSEQELKYARWLYFTAKHKIPTHQRKTLINKSGEKCYEYSCKLCDKGVFTCVQKKSRIRSGSTAVRNRWEVEKIDRNHKDHCNNIHLNERTTGRKRCMHLKDLVQTIKNKEGNTDDQLQTREITVDILQDIYLGRAFCSSHVAYTEVDSDGNILRLGTDKLTYGDIKAGRKQVLRMTRSIFKS